MLILGPDSTVKPVPDPGPGSRGILILDPIKSEKSPMLKKNDPTWKKSWDRERALVQEFLGI